LRRVEPLCRLPGSALQQLAMCGFYEDLEKGVTRECWIAGINYATEVANSNFSSPQFFAPASRDASGMQCSADRWRCDTMPTPMPMAR